VIKFLPVISDGCLIFIKFKIVGAISQSLPSSNFNFLVSLPTRIKKGNGVKRKWGCMSLLLPSKLILSFFEGSSSDLTPFLTQVASQMAIGAVKNSNANLSIAITGIAGPKSDDTEKPVGLVFIASFNDLNKKLIVEEFVFYGNRSQIRNLTLQSALEILISQL
jgi:hypothetical protein